MPSFDELIAARRTARPATRDVEILLDPDLSDQIEQAQADLDARENPMDRRLGEDAGVKAAQERLAQLRAEAVGSVVTLRLTRLPGDVWADITATTVPRQDAILDHRYGYDVTEVTKKALPRMAKRLEDENLVEIDDAAWEVLFGLPEFDDLQDAVFILQEWEPAQRLEAAKKALREGSTTTPALPAPSASPSSASTGGNRSKKSSTTTTKTGASFQRPSAPSPSST